MKHALALLGLAALSSCGPILGIPCETRADCGASMSCFSAPGGYCSHGCSAEGIDFDCPSGTTCTFFGGTALVCSTPCKIDADCRINYECAAVLNTKDKYACRPTHVKR